MRTWWMISLLLFAGCQASTPYGPVQAKHAQVELLSYHSSKATPKDVLLGVHFILEKGWHIYWANPGDSGQPPSFQWQLPAGASAGEIKWPTPDRLQASPEIVDYGYHDDVLLVTPVQLLGAAGHVAVDAKWLICREVCLPDHAILQTDISKRVGPSTAISKLFEETEKKLPQSLPPDWRATATLGKDSLLLRIEATRPLPGAQFFPLDPDVVENAAPQIVKIVSHPAPKSTERVGHPDGKSTEITLKKSDLAPKSLATLRGVLAMSDGTAYRIEALVVQSIK